MDGRNYGLVKSDDEDEYQMEADLEAMWAAREAGAADVDVAAIGDASGTPAELGGGPVASQMAVMLVDEQNTNR